MLFFDASADDAADALFRAALMPRCVMPPLRLRYAS